MTKFIYILPLICSLSCFGQAESKEEFLSEVFKTIYSEDKYDLLDTADNYVFDYIDSFQLIPTTKGIIDSSTLSQLIASSEKSVSEKWGRFGVHNIHRISKKSRRYIQVLHNYRGIGIKRGVKWCSNPLFNDDHSYAMIRTGRICGQSCGDSCVYFFKRINGKWELILKTFCVIV